jgi:hypothetical protein
LGVRQVGATVEDSVETAPGILQSTRPDVEHGQAIAGPEVVDIEADRALIGRARLFYPTGADIRRRLIKPFLEDAGVDAPAARAATT